MQQLQRAFESPTSACELRKIQLKHGFMEPNNTIYALFDERYRALLMIRSSARDMIRRSARDRVRNICTRDRRAEEMTRLVFACVDT